jgi:serine protease Do
MKSWIAAALVWLTLQGTDAALAQNRSRAADLSRLSQSLESVVGQVGPAVVQIQVTAYGPGAGSSRESAVVRPQRNTGSGVILSRDGFILTNAHVIEGGRRFTVVIPRPAVAGVPNRSALPPVSQQVPATLVGTDRETDLAVLKVDLTDLPFARMGNSDSLTPGQVVLAFGSPFGLTSSVTMGVVSAVGRQLEDEDRMIYIQTDTPINPGNSGGPLVSDDGLVVGINTLILSQSGGSEGIGFAAPVNIARFVYEQIRSNGRVRRGTIGVFAQTITPQLAAGLRLAREWGVVLGDVYPNSPAARAGLRIGDVILSVNGKPVENGRQFDVTLYQRPAGTPVNLEVGRGLQRLTLKVPVIERNDEMDRLRAMVNREQNLVERLGILGLDVTPELAQVIPDLRAANGVAVAGVVLEPRGSPGLAAGDVIYGVNGESIANLAGLRAAVSRLGAGEPAVLHVGREGRLRFVTLTLD